MRANACPCCLLLTLLMAAAPLFPVAIGQAQPAAADAGNDRARAPDDDEEEAGNDTAEREALSAAGDPSRLSTGARGDGFEPDADEASGTVPGNSPIPTTPSSSARRAATDRIVYPASRAKPSPLSPMRTGSPEPG